MEIKALVYLIQHPIVSFDISSRNVKETKHSKTVIDCDNDDVVEGGQDITRVKMYFG